MWWERVKQRYPALRHLGHKVRAVTTGEPTPKMAVYTCTLFYSYFRLHATIEVAPVFGKDALPNSDEASVRLLFEGVAPPQQFKCRRLADGAAHEVFLDALVDPAKFPGIGVVEMKIGNRTAGLALDWLLLSATEENLRSMFYPFKDQITAWVAANGPARPKLLDIGGRARSGNQLSEYFPECDVTTFDIIADPGVHVVGDAHEMSKLFPPASFDFAQSISVFEHLVMPWKVAVELNRVLKPGGMAHIFSHQTIGMHDMPWDFFRFSDASWTGLFNRYTGFEIVQTQMSNYMHIVPRAWSEHYRNNEGAGGFDCSAVIVRKIGDAKVAWDVAVPDILQTAYPRGQIAKGG